MPSFDAWYRFACQRGMEKLDAHYQPGKLVAQSSDANALKLVYVGYVESKLSLLNGKDFDMWINSGWGPEGASKLYGKLQTSSWEMRAVDLPSIWYYITDVKDQDDFPAMLQDYYKKFIQPGAGELRTHVHGWILAARELEYLLLPDSKLTVAHFLKFIDKSPWTFGDLSQVMKTWHSDLWQPLDAADRVWTAVVEGKWDSLGRSRPSDDLWKFCRPLRHELKTQRDNYHSVHTEQQNAAYDREQRELGTRLLEFNKLFMDSVCKNHDSWNTDVKFGGNQAILESFEALMGEEQDYKGVPNQDREWTAAKNYLLRMCKGAIARTPPSSAHLREYWPFDSNDLMVCVLAALLWRHADNWPGRVLIYGKTFIERTEELARLRDLHVLYDSKTNTYSEQPNSVTPIPYFHIGKQTDLFEALFYIHPALKWEQLKTYMNPMRRAIHSHQLSETAKAKAVEAAKLENKSDGSDKKQKISASQSLSVSSGQKSLQHYLIHPADSKLPNREVDPKVQYDVSTEELMQHMASYLGKPSYEEVPYANLEARVSLTAYAADTPVWVVLYSQRLFGARTSRALLKNGHKGAVALDPPLYLQTKELHPEDSFWVYVYAERHLCPGEKKSCPQYITRVGYTSVAAIELDLGKSVRLFDINGHQVGNVILTVTDGTIAIDSDAEKPPTVPDMDKLIQETEKQRKHYQGGTNITPKLTHLTQLVVKQHWRSIPMWAFCLLHLPPSEPLESLEYYEQAVVNAKHLLGITGSIPLSRAVEAEILNEMQTLPTRGQLYVPDTTKMSMLEADVDDWTSPLVAPDQKLLGLDCEDAALRIVQDAWWWLHAPSAKGLSPEAQRMAQAEQGYITFFVAMTLKVAGVFKGQSSSAQWVYHAAALKLDRRYVLQKLGMPQSGQGEWLPAVLLEGTAYTTGCWDYTPVHAETADKVSFQSQANFSKGDTISKVTPTMMRRKDLYGHVLSMFSPELALDHGIVEISLSQDGKLAASAKDVMRYSDQVSWHTIKIANVQERLEPLKQWAYPPVQEPMVTKEKLVTYPKPRQSELDFLLREVDWNAETQKELEAQFGGNKKLHATRIQIADDLAVWQITDAEKENTARDQLRGAQATRLKFFRTE